MIHRDIRYGCAASAGVLAIVMTIADHRLLTVAVFAAFFSGACIAIANIGGR